MEKNQFTAEFRSVEVKNEENKKRVSWQVARNPTECVSAVEIPEEQASSLETSVIQHDQGTSAPVKTQVPLSAMEALPDEILIKIFQWLPFITQISVLPEVCHRWKSVHTDFSVLTCFNFRDIPVKSINKWIHFTIQTIKTNERLRPTKLILPQVDKDTDEHTAIVNLLETGSNLGWWKCLTKFSARDININEEVLSNFISSLNSEIFTELTIKFMTPYKMNSICRYLTKLHRFNMWDEVVEDCLQHLVDAGSDMKCLRELRLNVTQYDHHTSIMTNLLKTYAEQFELLTLKLYRYDCGESFMESLSLCRKLTYLDVRFPACKEYDEVCTTLSGMTQLQQLYLDANNLRGSRSSEFALFRELKNLRHVFFDSNIQDEDVTDLCNSCGHCLETIHLLDCYELTYSSVESIMTQCNKLVALKVELCSRINKVKLLEKLTENAEKHLLRLVLLNLMLRSTEEIPDDLLSNCLKVRPTLFIKTNSSITDDVAASSTLNKVMGPNSHHKKRLISQLCTTLPNNYTLRQGWFEVRTFPKWET